MMPKKRFDEWNEYKKTIEEKAKIFPFREREIWRYSAGENIGTEVSGKQERFSRPVLILRKYGANSFFGVPLTSKLHNGRWFTAITVNGDKGSALLSQSSSLSAKRLLGRLGKVSQKEFNTICLELQRLLFKK